MAYTGVGYNPTNHNPDNGAMAAALSIGKKIAPSQNQSQHLKPPPIAHLGSLLKRSPSLQSNSIRLTLTPKHSRSGSVSSDRHSFTPRVQYTVDDSFTDSQIDAMGHEADAHYSNHAQLRDLKLTHLPPQPQVKMVKKYVPTPNGIKIVEVPESTMKEAIARSNSMRTGLSISRSGSLTSSRNNLLSRVPRSGSRSGSLTLNSNGSKPQKRVVSKRSTLVPKIDESQEENDQNAASAELQRQIEEEKKLALKLEAQRKEVEQLRQLRLENEKKRAELEKLQEEEKSYSRLTSPVPERAPASIAASLSAPQPVKPQSSTFDDIDDAPQAQSTDDEDVPIQPVPFAVDELEQKKIGKSPKSVPSNEGEEVTSSYSLDDTSVTHAVPSDTAPTETVDPDDVIQNYVVYTETPAAQGEEDEFGIVEVPNEDESPSLAQQVKARLNNDNSEGLELPESSNDRASGSDSVTPKFDPTPEIIADEPKNEPSQPPAVEGFASSIKSGSSNDSRPIKSAMKNSRSNYSLNNNSNTNVSPAQQAYLSLTTAENTRLNSKLSSGQLTDREYLNPQQNFHPGPPRSPVNSQKFAAATLRKTPSQQAQPQQGNLSDRSLRPRNLSDASNRQSTGGMSGRTFKSVQPQGLPPHPYQGPNYQSPAKLKAAELFARANNRPASFQQPLKRESSFNKGSDGTAPENGVLYQPPQKSGNHRFTLRPEPSSQARQGNIGAPAVHTNNQQNGVPQYSQAQQAPHVQHGHSNSGGFKGFKSRIAADSDDEDSAPAHVGGGGFRSRFRDLVDHGQPNNTPQVNDVPITTLRDTRPPPEEKKPKKKKFLKKLFGRS